MTRNCILTFLFLFTVCTMYAVQEMPNERSADSIEIISLLDLGYSEEAQTPNKAIATYKKAARLSESSGFDLGSFRANSYIAIVFNDLAVYDSAIYYNRLALPFAEKLNYKKGIAATYINLGNTYQFYGEYDKVVENYINGINIFKSTKDSVNASRSYQNLASLFSSIGQHDKELEYLKLALLTNPNENIEQNGMVYGDLGLAYSKLDQLPKALSFFQKADSVSKKVSNKRLDFFVARNFGEYHMLNNTYNKAIPFYLKALQLNDSLNEKYYRADLLRNLGEAYSKTSNFTQAKTYLEQALAFAKANNIKELQEKIYLELALMNAAQGNYKKAYEYKNLSEIFSDSLKNENHIKQINRLEKQFATKNKDNEITVQKLKLEQQESQLQKRKMQTNYAIAIAIFSLITMIGLWMYYKQRQRRKNQELLVLKNEAQINSLESLIEGEERERFRIAKELHDGVNGYLSAIKHKLNTFLELNNKTIKEAVVMIDKSCEQVRAISHNLVPPALENFDLQTATSDYCTNMNNIHPPKITFNYLGDDVVLPKIVEINIFRIIQELVTNSIKHANASKIDVQLSIRDNSIQLAVEDDGTGFDLENTESDGIGISNLKHRVSFLNGEMDISSNSEGTFVNIFMDKTRFNDY